MRAALPVIALWLTVALRAQACGVCLEDKMALTYDHAIAQHAFAQGQVIVFCELSGRIDNATLAQVTRRTASLTGVQRNTVRSSSQPATVSFALDAAATAPTDAVQALRKSLPAGVGIVLLKVMTGSR